MPKTLEKTSIKNKGEKLSRAAQILGAKVLLTSLKATGEEKTLPPVTIPADEWKEYSLKCEEKAALERRIRELKTRWGYGEGAGKTLAENHGMKDGDSARFVVINGNGDEMGKGTLSFVSAFVMGDNFRLSLS